MRILSRISAAAFSVNVTATIRSGSIPPARRSRYTSTSFFVLPVPALANTTVLFAMVTAEPPVVAIGTILFVGGIGVQLAAAHLLQELLDTNANLVKEDL